MNYRVIFNPEARSDLFHLYTHIASEGFPDRAENYTRRLEDFCLSLKTFPHRGTSLDHIRSGMRFIGFERRVAILFQISGDSVIIFRILYGGRNLASLFSLINN